MNKTCKYYLSFWIIGSPLEYFKKVFKNEKVLFDRSGFLVMNSVAPCDIEASGRFKYILIVLTHKATKETKVIVRGYSDCPFHGESY